MKWLLKWFPRPWLIQLSLWGQPFLKWWFKGSRYTDPIDGSRYRKFLPYGYKEYLRQNALCPGTLSLERHRLLWLYLQEETSFLSENLKVLHVAPEQVFYQRFNQLKHWQYKTTDLYSPLADVKADLCALPFEAEQFDLIFCNHVLEHIPDDHKAMKELFRVLKKGGTAILQVPLEQNRKITFEDNSITDPKERNRIFGQYDHVRVYGIDYFDRLESIGFKTQKIDYIQSLSPERIETYRLPKGEWIPIAQRPL